MTWLLSGIHHSQIVYNCRIEFSLQYFASFDDDFTCVHRNRLCREKIIQNSATIKHKLSGGEDLKSVILNCDGFQIMSNKLTTVNNSYQIIPLFRSVSISFLIVRLTNSLSCWEVLLKWRNVRFSKISFSWCWDKECESTWNWLIFLHLNPLLIWLRSRVGSENILSGTMLVYVEKVCNLKKKKKNRHCLLSVRSTYCLKFSKFC